MTTPRSSLSVPFPAESMKGPIAMHPFQRSIPRKMSPVINPKQNFFMKESKALGAVQIMNGFFHIALGGLLVIQLKVHAPICITLWYPFWGGILHIISGSLLAAAAETNSRKSLVKGKIVMNSLSLFAAISGIILLIMDIFNITVSHFFKLESLHLIIKAPVSYINIHRCEPSHPSETNELSSQYCHSIRFTFLGIFAVMLTFAVLQKFVTAGTVEHEWKRLCSRSKANVVLLSAAERKEQEMEKKEGIELMQMTTQPKNEEDIEIIPVQEVEETEMNFPEPPQDQESSPVENDLLN